MDTILAVGDIAELLQVAPSSVTEWPQRGSLPGFRVAGEWRVRETDLNGFLNKLIRDENLRALERALSDPVGWAQAIDAIPGLREEIEAGDFAEGSFGAGLQEFLRQADSRRRTAKLVDIDSRRNKK